MMWKDELAAIDELSKRVANLGSDISRQIVQLESRRDTLTNEIAKLEADYEVLHSRNEEAKKQFKNNMRLDIEELQEGKRRVQQRESQLLEKEKEIRQLKNELEAAIASAKSSKQTTEAMGRQYARK